MLFFSFRQSHCTLYLTSYLYGTLNLDHDACTFTFVKYFLWSPYGIGQTIIFLPCGFFFLLLSFFSSPNHSRRRLDVCHTSTHGVALVRIYDAGLKRAACSSLKIQDAKKSPKIAIWAPLPTKAGRLSRWALAHILVLSFSFFPCLFSTVGDWMSTILPHVMWP